MQHRSSTETIIGALRVLSRDIVTDDGVVSACLREAADRMEELNSLHQIPKTLYDELVKFADSEAMK